MPNIKEPLGQSALQINVPIHDYRAAKEGIKQVREKAVVNRICMNGITLDSQYLQLTVFYKKQPWRIYTYK